MNKYFLILIFPLFIGCDKLQDPEIGVNTSDIFSVKFEDEKTSIQADGQERLKIIVDLKEANANSVIILETEYGKFVGAANENNKKIQLTASGKSAEVYLISSNDIIKNHVSVHVGEYTISKEIIFTASYPDNFTITTDKFALKADLSSKARITINSYRLLGVVSNGIPISFSISPSTLAYIVPQTFTKDGIATADIISKDTLVGNFVITASMFGSNNDTIYHSLTMKLIKNK